MKKKIIEIETFRFNELKKDIKEEVLDRYRDINTDYDGWYYDDYINEEIAKKYGLEVNSKEICFDLDRENYVYFETFNHGRKENWITGIAIADYKKFVKKAGLKWRKSLDQAFTISHEHYGGGYGKNTIEADSYYDDSEITDEEIAKLNFCLKKFCEEVLSHLRSSYDYLISDEAVIETINSNDFYFLKNGETNLAI